MQAPSEPERLAAELRNAAWLVRNYPRAMQRLQRAQAIQRLGLTVRHAFTQCDDFELLLIALVEGLKPENYEKPF